MPSRFFSASLISATLALVIDAHAEASGNIDLTTACTGCHGLDGKGRGEIPAIAGVPQANLTQALRDYKAGRRPLTVMQRIAGAYSDSEIDDLAAQLSRQAPAQ
ncbi:MAG: sulfide dehydrogenase [Methylococcus sp.]|jgi:sulfide dehydrogenase cytochrome subunit|nr:MAG: sulfide dehydrogenase [Methylococcus sp.]